MATPEEIENATNSLIENEAFIDSYVESDDQTDVTTPDGTTVPSLQKRDLQMSESGHAGRVDNPHGVTKTQVGLGNAEDTSDNDKPVSTAQQAALDTKADQSATGVLLATKADSDLNNVPNGSVPLSMLAAEVTALLETGFDPAKFLGNITALSDDLVDPVTNTGGWYTVSGVAGAMSGTHSTGLTVEDGGMVLSDGANWNVRAASPTNIPNGTVTSAMLANSLKQLLDSERNVLNDEHFVWTSDDATGGERVLMRILLDGLIEGHFKIGVTGDSQYLSVNHSGGQTSLDFDLSTYVPSKVGDQTISVEPLSVFVGVREADYVQCDSENRVAFAIYKDGSMEVFDQVGNVSAEDFVSKDGLPDQLDVEQDKVTEVARAPQEVHITSGNNVVPFFARRSLNVFGDSIATITTWPPLLASVWDQPIVSQAVGGQNTSEQMGMMNNFKLNYPISGVDTPPTGAVNIKLQRYAMARDGLTSYALLWLDYNLVRDETTKVEFFNNGVKIGETRDADFLDATVDYATDTSQIGVGSSHGLSVGEVVWFDSDEIPKPAQDISRATHPNETTAGGYHNLSQMPQNLVYRKPYWVATTGADWITVAETNTTTPIDLGSDPTVALKCYTGFTFNWDYDGSTPYEITFKTHGERDDWTQIYCVGTNDFISGNASDAQEASETLQLWKDGLFNAISNSTPQAKRVIAYGPFIRHAADYGPSSLIFNAIKDAREYLSDELGANHCDVHAAFHANRGDETQALNDLGITTDKDGAPIGDLTTTPQQFSSVYGIVDAWVGYDASAGVGYLPMKYRSTGGSDDVHPNSLGKQLIADTIESKLQEVGY